MSAITSARDRALEICAAVLAAAGVALVPVQAAAWQASDSPLAAVIRHALGDPQATDGQVTSGLKTFIDACDALLLPAVLMALAAGPLGLVVGGAALFFGSRHGPRILLGTVAGLITVACAKGFIA